MVADGKWDQLNWIRIKDIKIYGSSPALSSQPTPPQAVLLRIYQHQHTHIIDIVVDFTPHNSHKFIDVLLPFPLSIPLLKIDAIFHEDSWEMLRGYTRVLCIPKTV